jgi:hypothetical protein
MLTTLSSASGKTMAPAMLAALTTLAGSVEALVEAHAQHVVGLALESPDLDKLVLEDEVARTNCESAMMLVQQLILDAQH